MLEFIKKFINYASCNCFDDWYVKQGEIKIGTNIKLNDMVENIFDNTTEVSIYIQDNYRSNLLIKGTFDGLELTCDAGSLTLEDIENLVFIPRA